MREFKFRAWTGKLLIYNVGINAHGKCIVFDYEEKKYIEAEVMQFTGFRDKNNKEIYEGDIVKYKYAERLVDDGSVDSDSIVDERIGVVNYKDGSFSPLPQFNYCDDYWYSWKSFDFEVIGNIYQNPELVK
jgi:uncharacterized phage protein (TIGR01671 family)